MHEFTFALPPKPCVPAQASGHPAPTQSSENPWTDDLAAHTQTECAQLNLPCPYRDTKAGCGIQAISIVQWRHSTKRAWQGVPLRGLRKRNAVSSTVRRSLLWRFEAKPSVLPRNSKRDSFNIIHTLRKGTKQLIRTHMCICTQACYCMMRNAV